MASFFLDLLGPVLYQFIMTSSKTEAFVQRRTLEWLALAGVFAWRNNSVTGYAHAFANHTKKEYTRGDVHENRAECLFSLLKPYLRMFRGISKMNLPGYLGFFQFLRNYRQLTAFEQAELILYAALDPAIASRAQQGAFVRCLDHFDLLQTAIN
ncbi:MAG: hypothetical protein ACRERE_06640 [Candidatus Entotheonellia bacterium]